MYRHSLMVFLIFALVVGCIEKSRDGTHPAGNGMYRAVCIDGVTYFQSWGYGQAPSIKLDSDGHIVPCKLASEIKPENK